MQQSLSEFLDRNALAQSDIDLILLGTNGDSVYDPIYNNFADQCFPGKSLAWYKHLCGEYHTATGFGLYVAANILKRQNLPEILYLNNIVPPRLQNILIYNQYRNVNHSLMLVQAC
jgi:hypothetical protein